MSIPRVCFIPLVLLAAAPAARGLERGDRTTIVDNEFNRNTSAQDMILMLIKQLGKPDVEAQDAASKLAQIGKPAVPMLADLVERGPTEKVRYYATMALSRVRDASAADALLPLVSDVEKPRELRLMAIDAAAGSNSDSAAAVLAKLAGSDDDAELRMKALQSISVMPVAWRDGEEMFVKCLDDPDDEIRLLATKVCFYAAAVRIVYGAAEPRLLAMVERDSLVSVRCQALRALSRMKSGRAVSLSVRLLSDPLTAGAMRRQAMAAVRTITEVPLRDEAGVLRWWEKYGKARYEKAPALKPFTVKPKKVPEEKPASAIAKTNPQRQEPATPPVPPARVTERTPQAGEPARKARVVPIQPDAQKRRRLDDSDDNAPLRGLPIR